jgi:hypothetical protein
MITTTGMATRIGTTVRYRLAPACAAAKVPVLPESPAGTPWLCRTIRPATDAAIAVTSITGRRQGRAGRLERRVSAEVIRAGLLAGAGLRYCHTAMSGGPASAAAAAIAASGQLSGVEPPPGTSPMARPAPISTPGPAEISAPPRTRAATCHREPPRARSRTSSSSRRATSIRAASRITAAPVTIRLTNSSRSTVSTAAWALRNCARTGSSGELTASAPSPAASGAVSGGAVVVARFSAWYRPCAWSACRPEVASGYSQWTLSPGPPNTPWTGPSWLGSAMSAPSQ